MAAGTNTAGTLPHDQNAGRFVIPTLPPSLQGTDIGKYLTDLSNRMSNAYQQIQRAFRTQAQGSVEVVVQKDTTTDGTNWTRVYIPMRVLAVGATNSSNISGTNCA